MNIVIHCRNLDLSSALRSYTESKLERALHHFEGIVKEIEVHLSIAKNPRVHKQTAEVTIFADGAVIRAQERSENLYASIDLVASKLCRQLRKYKEKHNQHVDHFASISHLIENDIYLGDSLLEGKRAQLPEPGVKQKYFKMEPITIDEARRRLELIDHSFFLFREINSNQLKVIYKRNHGGYGIIQERT